MKWYQQKPGMIPSLDVPFEQLTTLISDLDDITVQNKNPIYALKIGALLELEGLKKVVSHIRNYSRLPIIIDHQKLADIPSIITKFVEKIVACEVDGAILLGYVGPSSISTFIESCQENGIASYIVAEMSHEGASNYIKDDTPSKIATLARDLRATGIVCPATKPESIQNCAKILKGSSLGIMSPGHGPQGGGADRAVQAGADWIVVGREFYTSANPKQSLINLGKLIIDEWNKKNLPK
ncbi:MAG: orotidine 5'-phosphate decarboxylase [Candidatus Helarchaeota archaeon]|nr:orotidine 5'-phosphate decarboxylase [Candidatus Helarchaeota archaeon]